MAHPYSQLMLNSVLYNEFDRKWQDRRFIIKTLFFLVYTILMPFWCIAYLVTGENILHRKLGTPLAKFMNHMASFLWFEVLLVLSSIQDEMGMTLTQVSPIGRYMPHPLQTSTMEVLHGRNNICDPTDEKGNREKIKTRSNAFGNRLKAFKSRLNAFAVFFLFPLS